MSLIDKSLKIDCPMNIRDVFERVKSVSYCIEGMYVYACSDNDFCIYMQTKMSLWSWGENITIACKYLNNGQTQIHITNSPKVPTMLIDFGTGKKNLKKVVEALRQVLPFINVVII